MGYRTIILTRSSHFPDLRKYVFTGDLYNFKSNCRFLENAEMLFHCAAKLHYVLKMWQVNVKGTEILLRAASQVSVKYFCYLSSAEAREEKLHCFRSFYRRDSLRYKQKLCLGR